MTDGQITQVLATAEQRLIALSRQRNADLTPWFVEHRKKLLLLGQLLGRLAAASPAEDAQAVLSRARRLVEERLSHETSWFTKNEQLLAYLTKQMVAAAGLASREQPGTTAQQVSRSEPPSEPVLELAEQATDPRTNAERTKANLEAITIMARPGGPPSSEERAKLALYSGWGGLSLKAIQDRVPAGWLPEQRGLIFEYYTPTVVAKALAMAILPRLPGLPNVDGKVLALEPSAGIGRFVQALHGDGFDALKWTAVEYSRVSARLLQLLRPDVEVFQGPFEEWVAKSEERQGSYGLVVSNPPYGERGKAATLDRDPAYRYRNAYMYQMRRSCEFLHEGGLAAFIVPAVFLTGTGAEFAANRRQILLANHVAAAFRLPSQDEAGRPLFPGALLVTDLILLRSRGGILESVVDSDVNILAGTYFRDNPGFVLGREVGKAHDEDDLTAKPRFGYQVVGTFERLPDFEERPMCRDCALTRRPATEGAPAAPAEARDVPEHLAVALNLARRIGAYLALVASAEEQALKKAADLQPELKAALLAWDAEPSETKTLVGVAVKDHPELGALYSVFKGGALIPQISQPPAFAPRYSGDPSDFAAIARFLFGQQREVTLNRVAEFAGSLGMPVPSREAIRASLSAADFAFEGEAKLWPPEVYYTGELWSRYDAASAAAQRGDAMAAAQAARLLKLIGPATFAEIQAEPRMGWIPLAVIAHFINYVMKREGDSADYGYARTGGVLTLEGVDYLDLPLRASPVQVELIGYINHDMTYFSPKKDRRRSDEDIEERRIKLAAYYNTLFNQWIETRTDLQALVAEEFNRKFRGWRAPDYPTENLGIARWNEKKPLFWYQNSGVRRLVANHGGGLFFDVGLGKTRTVLATIALARQQGWMKRPVIVVPNSVVYNWAKEVSVVLPDFAIGIIGSKTRRLLRGERKGELESETDSPAERGAKWARFMAGLYDVCILTYSSLGRTRMREEALLAVLRNSTALSKEIGFRLRAKLERIKYLEGRGRKLDEEQQRELEALRAKLGPLKPTERREAIKAEREEAFIADLTTLPASQEYDPNVYWDDLGIDGLFFDEAHNGKNLWTAGPREGGQPKFLGAPQEASNLALQMYFRTAIVRSRTGGSGIYLADATPAKNSPLEFLSLLSMVDDNVWRRWGVSDSEQFLSQYMAIEFRYVVGTDLDVEKAPCVVGFRNLDQFREVLFRYGEFRTAKEVGLKVPRPEPHNIEVELDEQQESKYIDYLAQYESAVKSSAFDEGSKFKALALLQRMSLVAVHGELDEPPQLDASMAKGKPGKDKPKWTFKNAGAARSYSSPKIDAIARVIAARKDCGHLVFFENNAVHFWLRERLVELGIARHRIGILNGEVTATPLARQRVAEGFTSNSALYDVVIANKIAYEGVNLQGRTCTIFHGDLPWEPATLQQRNGRGHRQGNINEVIMIYYVLAKKSMDMARLQLIQGKREWLAAVVESAATETNNPGAQQQLSPEQWLMFLSRDPDKTQALLAAQREKQKEEAQEKTRKLAWAGVRSIAVRHRDLRAADPVSAARLREDIQALVANLESLDAETWPWKFILPGVAKYPTLSFAPTAEGAIYQTARYRRKNYAGKVIDSAEFGKVLYEPRLAIGFREGGSLLWEELELDLAAKKWAATRPEDWQEGWEPLLVEIEGAAKTLLAELGRAPWAFREARWDLANPEFLDTVWGHYGAAITSILRQSSYRNQIRLPVVTAGKLSAEDEDDSAASILPFTEAGYQTFLVLVPQSDLKWSDAESIAQWYWNRGIPRNLLTQRDQQRKSTSTRGTAHGEGKEDVAGG